MEPSSRLVVWRQVSVDSNGNSNNEAYESLVDRNHWNGMVTIRIRFLVTYYSRISATSYCLSLGTNRGGQNGHDENTSERQ
jgi:hypothetical protein